MRHVVTASVGLLGLDQSIWSRDAGSIEAGHRRLGATRKWSRAASGQCLPSYVLILRAPNSSHVQNMPTQSEASALAHGRHSQATSQ